MTRPAVRSVAPIVIASLAAAVALSGTAYAASKVNGKNIVKHSIAGDRVKSNTLTGAQIEESKLAEVPKSKVATSAQSVDGAIVQTFSFAVASDAAAQTVNVRGGALSGSCPSGSPLLVLAGADETGLAATGEGNDSSAGAFVFGNPELTPGSPSLLTPGTGSHLGAGIAIITRPSGKVTTIDFSYLPYPGSCTYAGTVIST